MFKDIIESYFLKKECFDKEIIIILALDNEKEEIVILYRINFK